MRRRRTPSVDIDIDVGTTASGRNQPDTGRRRSRRGSTAAGPVDTAGPRGWTGPAGGQSPYIQNPDWFRSTSVQACGMWPFAVGAGAPLSGVPLGEHLAGAGTVSMDPINWFLDGYLANPSQFVLGLPGNGKSTLVRKQVLGLAGMGVLPLICGDLKPDYVDLITAIDGQVLEVGPGRGKINPLDPGETQAVAARLAGPARTQLLAAAHSRATTMTSGLVTILRGGDPPQDYEESVIARALSILTDRHAGRGTPPEIADLLQIISEGPEDLRSVAVAATDAEYHDLTKKLRRSLQALLGTGRLGDTFAGQTTTGMRHDRPVVVDVSHIGDTQADLQAAVLLGTWSEAFAMIDAAHALADAGLEPRRHWFVVMDELWRVLRSGSGMVDRADGLTRLNRQRGVGIAYITHTMSDLEALPNEADRMKARGFVERAGAVICFGLPPSEMKLLRGVTHFSQAEEQRLTSWTTPPSWAAAVAPPGQGKAVLKVGRRPGIPLRVRLTEVEANLHDTNKLWRRVKAVGPATELDATIIEFQGHR